MFFSVKIALSSLKAHRLRASLAVVGVFLGALALTGVQHVSKAMYLKAQQETAKLGTNLFIARSGQISFRRSGSARIEKETTTFTVGDAAALLDGLPGAVLGAPFVTAEMPIRAAGVKIPSQIVATWPSYEAIRNFHPQYGRFLAWRDENERAKVCVLGRNIAERLFGDPEAAVGQQVFFFRAGARVVGVMEAKGADVVGTDQDDQVLVPLSTFMRRFSNQDWITGIYIQLSDSEGFATAKETATQILRGRHHMGPGQSDDFTVLTAQDTVQLQQQALDLVQTLGRISSSISFAVGGLGILSLMVLLVRTRRLEIGLRRAVGARRRDIMRQFILEAALMAGTGGTLGVAAAGVLGLVISGIGKMPLVFDPVFLLGPLIGSVLLGLGAGAYPAWEAAHVEVLDVLRNE